MSKEISEIYKIYDSILSNKQIIREQEKTKVTSIFGDEDVVVDSSDSGVAPPSGWTKGIKYILKNGGDVSSPIKAKVIATGKLSNTGNNYLYLETSDKNQVYVGNLSSISVVKNQSVDIGDKLGSVARGSYVYVCSKKTPIQNIISGKGELNTKYSGRYNPSGSITGDYLANQMVSPSEGLKEQRGGQEETQSFGPPLRGDLEVTSKMGRRRGKQHIGIDLRANSGTEIIAPLSGVVLTTDDFWPCGGRIRISHAGNFRTGFCHVKKFLVSPGQTVKQGDVIGLTGGGPNDPMPGRTDGPHLHYTLYKNNKLADPENYLGGQVVSAVPPPSYTEPTPDEREGDDGNTNDTESKMRQRAEKILDDVKKKLDLSNMTEEEKKKILNKLSIGAIMAAIAAGGVALYSLLSSVLSGVKSATTDTNTGGSGRYNPSGSKIGEYIGDVVKFMLPG
jgi:murein DD-endopeptidase MepM/ murein hydrolase activator NlpD